MFYCSPGRAPCHSIMRTSVGFTGVEVNTDHGVGASSSRKNNYARLNSAPQTGAAESGKNGAAGGGGSGRGGRGRRGAETVGSDSAPVRRLARSSTSNRQDPHRRDARTPRIAGSGFCALGSLAVCCGLAEKPTAGCRSSPGCRVGRGSRALASRSPRLGDSAVNTKPGTFGPDSAPVRRLED